MKLPNSLNCNSVNLAIDRIKIPSTRQGITIPNIITINCNISNW